MRTIRFVGSAAFGRTITRKNNHGQVWPLIISKLRQEKHHYCHLQGQLMSRSSSGIIHHMRDLNWIHAVKLHNTLIWSSQAESTQSSFFIMAPSIYVGINYLHFAWTWWFPSFTLCELC